MAEPDRVRLIHKLRLASDAINAVNKAAKEAEEKTRTRGEKKRKMVAAAPASLKDRVGRGEELPCVEICNSRQHDGGDDEMRADVMEFVTVGGKMPHEVYIELMYLLVPRWDNAYRV